MEPLQVSILVAFLFSILLVTKLLKRNHSVLNLPPGPPRLPLIGNIHQVAGSLPHRTFRDLSNKYGPLMYLQLGEVPTLIVSSAEYARQIMNTHDIIFASRPKLLIAKSMGYNWTNIIFAPYSHYWRQLRRICTTELMSTKRVQSLRPVRTEEREDMVKWISSRAGTSINLSRMLHSSAYTTTARAAFGEKCEEQEQYISLIQEGLKATTGFTFPDLYPSLKFLNLGSKIQKIHQEADKILGSIIAEHRHKKSSKGEDLVDVLLKFEGCDDSEFSLTTDNIKGVIQDVFTAGSEPSATAVSWAMSEMIRNPRVMEKAQAEVREVFDRVGRVDETAFTQLTYLKLVIKETLRLHPPTPLLLPRESRQMCKIGGFDIPRKTRVMINSWSISRDPKYWNDAESFYPERFKDSDIDFKGTKFEYTPFGAGRRMCPGIALALANMENQLALLLYHFDWKLPGGMKKEELDMRETFAVTAQRRYDLYLFPVPYERKKGV